MERPASLAQSAMPDQISYGPEYLLTDSSVLRTLKYWGYCVWRGKVGRVRRVHLGLGASLCDLQVSGLLPLPDLTLVSPRTGTGRAMLGRNES